MSLVVKHRGAVVSLPSEATALETLQAAVAAATGVPVANQKLLCRGKRVAADATPATLASVCAGRWPPTLMLVGSTAADAAEQTTAAADREAEALRKRERLYVDDMSGSSAGGGVGGGGGARRPRPQYVKEATCYYCFYHYSTAASSPRPLSGTGLAGWRRSQASLGRRARAPSSRRWSTTRA